EAEVRHGGSYVNPNPTFRMDRHDVRRLQDEVVQRPAQIAERGVVLGIGEVEQEGLAEPLEVLPAGRIEDRRTGGFGSRLRLLAEVGALGHRRGSPLVRRFSREAKSRRAWRTLSATSFGPALNPVSFFLQNGLWRKSGAGDKKEGAC